VWVVWGYVVGGTLVSAITQKCTINTKNTVLYTTQTLQHTQHTVVATQLNPSEGSTPATHWYTRGTQQLQQYTTITVVHSIYNGAKHINDTETFKLSERQVEVASTMISALILSTSSRHFNISVLGAVVRGAKKHYVNVKTEQTLSTLAL